MKVFIRGIQGYSIFKNMSVNLNAKWVDVNQGQNFNPLCKNVCGFHISDF